MSCIKQQTVKAFLSFLNQNFVNSNFVIRDDFYAIFSFVLKIPKAEIFLFLDRLLNQMEMDEIYQLCERKSRGEPLAYLFGEIDFYGCKILVNQDVLIPRVETEVLVEKVLRELDSRSVSVVFDLCSGSGCIGIGLKKQRPLLRVFASDISSKALDVAKNNSEINKVEIVFLEGDLLQPFSKEKIKADLVVCNPPYISENEFLSLDSSVKDFEPSLALTPGLTGLEIYERLALELPAFLNPGALVVFEIGYLQKEVLSKIFSNTPWKDFRCEKDYAGLDRFIFLEVE